MNDISLTVTLTVATDMGHHPSLPSKTGNHQLRSRLGDTKVFSSFFFFFFLALIFLGAMPFDTWYLSSPSGN